jgi:hypothetical protein
MRTILFVTCASFLSACLSGTIASGQPYPSTATSGAAARPERLTRDDVDKLLAQARAAIKVGELEEADAIVRRTERAGIRYPFTHLGDTPASVRRELNKAKKARGPAPRANTAKQTTGQAPSAGPVVAPQSTSKMHDPFQSTGNVPSWSTAQADSGAAVGTAGNATASRAMPGLQSPPATNSPSARPLANPFTPNLSTAYASDMDGQYGSRGRAGRLWRRPGPELTLCIRRNPRNR